VASGDEIDGRGRAGVSPDDGFGLRAPAGVVAPAALSRAVAGDASGDGLILRGGRAQQGVEGGTNGQAGVLERVAGAPAGSESAILELAREIAVVGYRVKVGIVVAIGRERQCNGVDGALAIAC